MHTKGWLTDVNECIENIQNDVFSLSEVYEFEEYLSSLHPEDKNIGAKIR